VISDAAAAIAEYFREDPASVEADLLTLCAGLIDRGLLAVKPDA
jgi:hypothetical protein